ncbi:hypothetical protein J28TS4_46250 [Paenibacillus lautus]|nr:hypothetical protein J28TS4_46250 [Paenibacillus lautus]
MMAFDQLHNLQLHQIHSFISPLYAPYLSLYIDLIYEYQQNSNKKLIPGLHSSNTTLKREPYTGNSLRRQAGIENGY